MRTKFRVWPYFDAKPRYYEDISLVVNDYNKEEITDSTIALIIGSVVVTYLDVGKIVEELYN